MTFTIEVLSYPGNKISFPGVVDIIEHKADHLSEKTAEEIAREFCCNGGKTYVRSKILGRK